MKRFLLHDIAALSLALPLASGLAQQVTPPAPLGKPATTAYRQLTPDGRVVYSDKPIKGAKVDESIEPPPKGSLWLSESKGRPPLPTQPESRPVNRVAEIPGATRPKSLDEANSDVIRAEMLLEDARKRQREGSASSDGASARNDASMQRQQALARDVENAEAALRRAQAARDALRRR